jgi:hypothetical protein
MPKKGSQRPRHHPFELVVRDDELVSPGHQQGRTAPLSLALPHAGSVARTMDPQLAAFYHRLTTEHGHCHTQAPIGVDRKLAERT